MRALIYDPYLDTAGGGERYMMTAASLLKKHGYDVDVFWKDSKIGAWLKTRLGIDLSHISFVDETNYGLRYDLVFWLSDGSLPLLLGKKNVVHFQTPFKGVGGRSIVNRAKKFKINEFICNSEFTKKIIDQEFGITSKVIHPPIDTQDFKPGKKENIILFVGRYSQLQQLKRQDVLIDSFKKLVDSGLSGWKLILVGGSEVGGREFVSSLKKQAGGYPVHVLENLPLEEVQKIYAKAKIFWSASGYGVDESENPEKVEHFGMTVVEAMSAGCVPIVVNKGGHKEIIKNQGNGFLWNSTIELAHISLELTKDERRRKEVAAKAKKDSQKFSADRFEKKILAIFS